MKIKLITPEQSGISLNHMVTHWVMQQPHILGLECLHPIPSSLAYSISQLLSAFLLVAGDLAF